MSITSDTSGQPYEETQLFLHVQKEIADRTKTLPVETVEQIEVDVHAKLHQAFTEGKTNQGHADAILERSIADHTPEEQ